MTLSRSEILDRLTQARGTAVSELGDAIHNSEVVGVMGDGQVGKTTLIRHLLHHQEDRMAIKLNLNEASSYGELARQWTLSLASTTLGADRLSDLVHREASDWSLTTRRALAQFTEAYGDEVSSFLTEPAKDAFHGRESISALVRATAAAGRSRMPLLFIDHLEAPGLAFRHPIDVAELLWQVRSVLQYGDYLRVVMSCRTPAIQLATGEKAAFYGDAHWVRLTPPTLAEFAAAAAQPEALVADVLQFTRGHVTSTIDVLTQLGTRRKTFAAVQDVAREQRDLAKRTTEYARSLHRLGGRLLRAIAQGRGPYRAVPEENPKAIARAMQQLHLAGLVEQPEEGRWRLVDPRVEWWLGGAATTPDANPGGGVALYVFDDDISGERLTTI